MEQESEADPNLRLAQESSMDPGIGESVGMNTASMDSASAPNRIPKRQLDSNLSSESSGQLFTAEQATSSARRGVANWRRSTPMFASKSKFLVLGWIDYNDGNIWWI